MRKFINVIALTSLLILILFRSNIIIFFSNIFSLLQEKNDYTIAEKQVLEAKISYLENEIQSLNNFKDKLPLYANYNYFVSKVLYRENYFENSKLVIKGGTENGIKKGMAVVNELGMVGVVSKVDKNLSEINMLTNANNISVKIRNSYGKLEYKEGIFRVSDISRDEDIRLNDEVYTSTLGNIKEKLYIGRVVKVNVNTLEKEIIIESAVDFRNLNYILVVGEI